MKPLRVHLKSFRKTHGIACTLKFSVDSDNCANLLRELVDVPTGLILVPNGENMGYSFGDTPSMANLSVPLGHRTSGISSMGNLSASTKPSSHSWGIFFTILGTVLLDFDADACQSPARAYLLDVTLPGKKKKSFVICALYSRCLDSRGSLDDRGSCQGIEHLHNHGWTWRIHGLRSWWY